MAGTTTFASYSKLAASAHNQSTAVGSARCFSKPLLQKGHLDLDTVGNVPFLNGGLFEENDLDKRAGRP